MCTIADSYYIPTIINKKFIVPFSLSPSYSDFKFCKKVSYKCTRNGNFLSIKKFKRRFMLVYDLVDRKVYALLGE